MKALTYVEIDVDRCSNTFGASPCAAALGVGNDAAVYWDFANSVQNGFTAQNTTLAFTSTGMTSTQTAGDAVIQGPASQAIDGSEYFLIVIDWERISNGTAFDGTVYYVTPGHSESASFNAKFSNRTIAQGRGLTVIDMSALFIGGTDWISSTINQIRFDFDQTGTGVVKVHSIRVCRPGPNFKCYNSLKTCMDRVHLTPQTETMRFSMASEQYADEGVEAFPNMVDVSFTPGTISLGGDLGQRATFSATFHDHPHSDTGPGGDRYLADRGFDPWTKGSFWSKFRARFPFLTGRTIRVYRGYVGDVFPTDFDTRYYVIDSFDGPSPSGAFSITAKDVLKLADDDKSQAPFLSEGFLSANITNIATSAVLQPTGVGALYPASGYVNIGGSEICAFTRSGDTLTLTRAQFNTVGSAHSAQDLVQLCLYYNAQSPADILYDLFVTYAGVPATYINKPVWQNEVNTWLQSSYTALIPSPTGVNQLASELIEQAALAVWWDDSLQKISLLVLRQISTSAATLDESNINQSSMRTQEQPDTRISQVWTYYALINPLVDLSQTSNYRSVELEISGQLENDYQQAAVKQIFSRWIPQFGRSIATKLNNLIIGRYQVPPRMFSFDVFGPSASFLDLGQGYNVGFRTLTDEQGTRITVPIQITRLSPNIDKYSVEAEEALFAAISAADLNTRVIIIDTSTNDFNLKTVHDSLFPPITDPTGITITCIIQAGVIVGNDQSLQSLTGRGVAFNVGAFPFGTNITIQLDGDIRAGGGKGGRSYGPKASPHADNGQIGGTGLLTTIAVKIKDTTGRTIAGGGGGGGAFSSGFLFGQSTGGSGGAGQVAGLKGDAAMTGVSITPGNDGTLLAGGAVVGGNVGSGRNGAGGNPGTAGQNGNDAGQSTIAASNGGAAGRAIDGVAFITYTNLTPTIVGPTI